MQDLTVVLTTSSVFGTLFEAIKQPTLNGYILAGSLVGPDGLALVKELVQVESLAQVAHHQHDVRLHKKIDKFT